LNIKIFKVQNSIYFVNCENFLNQIYKHYGFSPVDKIMTDSVQKFGSINKNFDKPDEISDRQNESSRKDPDLLLDLSAVNYLDTNGAKCLQQLIEDFKKINVFVYICGSQGIKLYKTIQF